MFPAVLSRFALTTILLGAVSLAPAAEFVSQTWVVPDGSDYKGNIWMPNQAANSGFGIQFIPANAAQNTYPEDIAVVLSGTSASYPVNILSAASGTFLGSFLPTATGDSSTDQFRIAASSDGYIFIAGMQGTVRMYQLNGTQSLIVPRSFYSTVDPDAGQVARGLAVQGSVAAGLAKLFVAIGPKVYVFGNSTVSTTTFTYINKIETGIPTTYAVAAPGSASNYLYMSGYTAGTTTTLISRATINWSPFSYSVQPVTYPFPGHLLFGLAVDNNLRYLAFKNTLGSPENGYGIAHLSLDGLTMTNIPPAAGLDSDGDGLYDAGPLSVGGGGGGVTMNQVTGSVFGYSAKYTDETGDGVVFQIDIVDGTSVDNWSMY